MTDAKETFAAALQRVREEKGWSQDQLGHMVDVTQQAVARWEAGQGMPRPSKRRRLRELFGDFWDESQAPAIHKLESVPHYTERVRRAVDVAVFEPRREDDVWREIMQHTPDQLHRNVQATAPADPDRRDRFDYVSDRLVLEVKTQGRPTMPVQLMQMWLWRLSSHRLEFGKDRAYALVVVVPDTIDAFRPDKRRRELEHQADLHGIIFRTVTRPEVVADLIRSAEGIARG